MPDKANGDWTREQIEAEAEAFLEDCRKAAISIKRLNNMQLAADCLIDAIIFVGDFRRRLDEELFADVKADADLSGTTQAWAEVWRMQRTTLGAFRR